jgi:tRNA pseudouridine(38-40) synthase
MSQSEVAQSKEEQTTQEQKSTVSAILQSLGLKHANEAVEILNSLLQQNIISTHQLKSIQKQQKFQGAKQNNKRKADTNANRYMTRHIALKFHYDGATYNGLAENINTPSDNSVEKILIAALQKTCLIESRSECGYSRSGRTDKGVSAFGQVVAMRVRSAFPIGTFLNGNDSGDDDRIMLQETDLPKNHLDKVSCWTPPNPKKRKKGGGDGIETPKLIQKEMSERDFSQIINNVLPPTIRILGWSPVTDEFSARFSTTSRIYRYFFIRRDLDIDAMTKALGYMQGRHDFRNLCKMNCEEVDNFERVVMYAKIVTATTCNSSEDLGYPYEDHNHSGTDNDKVDVNRQMCHFEIKGQAFLWHQIRCIASVLFMIGKRFESPEIVLELLDIKKNPGKPCYPFAADLPLVLHRCEYRNLRFGHSIQNLWRTSSDLECKWEELTLAAERLKNGMLSMRSEAEVHKDDVLNFVRSILEEKRKKEARRMDLFQSGMHKELPLPTRDANGIMTWNDALRFIHEHTGLRPNKDGPTVHVHIPLMQRGRGSTYKEKVDAILSYNTEDGKSTRRREAYEVNIKQKKVSEEEGEAFYKHMSMQGGSGFCTKQSSITEKISTPK